MALSPELKLLPGESLMGIDDKEETLCSRNCCSKVSLVPGLSSCSVGKATPCKVSVGRYSSYEGRSVTSWGSFQPTMGMRWLWGCLGENQYSKSNRRHAKLLLHKSASAHSWQVGSRYLRVKLLPTHTWVSSPHYNKLLILLWVAWEFNAVLN